MWKASIDYLLKFLFACIIKREFSILNGLWVFRTKKLNRLYIIEYLNDKKICTKIHNWKVMKYFIVQDK